MWDDASEAIYREVTGHPSAIDKINHDDLIERFQREERKIMQELLGEVKPKIVIHTSEGLYEPLEWSSRASRPLDDIIEYKQRMEAEYRAAARMPQLPVNVRLDGSVSAFANMSYQWGDSPASKLTLAMLQRAMGQAPTEAVEARSGRLGDHITARRDKQRELRRGRRRIVRAT